MRKFLLLFLAIPCLANDVCVLVDVSGTMGNYGNWQEPARHLISTLIAGSPESSGWTVEGKPTTQDFAITAGGVVHVLKFGSIKSGDFPFFAPEHLSNSVAGFNALFPTDALEFRESKTNKALAIAVGSKIAFGAGVSRLIIVSDFLVDSSINPSQQEFVNSFESASQVESPTIYTWAQNSHVQIKLLRVTNLGIPAPGQQPNPSVSLVLNSPRIFTSPERIIFSWQLAKPFIDAIYGITVVDPSSNEIVFSRNRFANSSIQWTSPPPGRFLWRIKATFPDGTEVSSTSGTVVVPSASLRPVFITIALLCSAGFGLWWYAKRRRPSLPPAAPIYPNERPSWKQ